MQGKWKMIIQDIGKYFEIKFKNSELKKFRGRNSPAMVWGLVGRFLFSFPAYQKWPVL